MPRRTRKNGLDRSLTVHVDKVDNGEWIVSTLDYPVDENDDDVRDGPFGGSSRTKREAVASAKQMARLCVDDGDFADAAVLVDGNEVAFYKPRRSKAR